MRHVLHNLLLFYSIFYSLLIRFIIGVICFSAWLPLFSFGSRNYTFYVMSDVKRKLAFYTNESKISTVMIQDPDGNWNTLNPSTHLHPVTRVLRLQQFLWLFDLLKNWHTTWEITHWSGYYRTVNYALLFLLHFYFPFRGQHNFLLISFQKKPIFHSLRY